MASIDPIACASELLSRHERGKIPTAECLERLVELLGVARGQDFWTIESMPGIPAGYIQELKQALGLQ